jgi:hypothetical protein
LEARAKTRSGMAMADCACYLFGRSATWRWAKSFGRLFCNIGAMVALRLGKTVANDRCTVATGTIRDAEEPPRGRRQPGE